MIRSSPIVFAWNCNKSVAKLPDVVSQMLVCQYELTFNFIGMPSGIWRFNSARVEWVLFQLDTTYIRSSIRNKSEGMRSPRWPTMILAFGKRLSMIGSATIEEIWPLGYSNTPFVHNLDRSLETPHFIYDIMWSPYPKIWYDSVAANSCAGPVSHGACPKVRSLICGMFERGWKYIGTWRSDTICQNTSYSGWS